MRNVLTATTERPHLSAVVTNILQGLIATVIAFALLTVCDRPINDPQLEETSDSAQESGYIAQDTDLSLDAVSQSAPSEGAEIGTDEVSDDVPDDPSAMFRSQVSKMRSSCNESLTDVGLLQFEDALRSLGLIEPQDRDTIMIALMWRVATELAIKRVHFEKAPGYVKRMAGELAPNVLCPIEDLKLYRDSLDQLYDFMEPSDLFPSHNYTEDLIIEFPILAIPGRSLKQTILESFSYAFVAMSMPSSNARRDSAVFLTMLGYTLEVSTAQFDRRDWLGLDAAAQICIEYGESYFDSTENSFAHALYFVTSEDHCAAYEALSRCSATTPFEAAHIQYVGAWIEFEASNFTRSKKLIESACSYIQGELPPYFKSLRAYINYRLVTGFSGLPDKRVCKSDDF